MYERKLNGHTTKNAMLLSQDEDITRGKFQVIELKSYETLVVRLFYDKERTLVDVYNPYEWSNTTIKHIGWFCDDINKRLGLDLCYYDLKYMAIVGEVRLIIEPDRVYYMNIVTGDITIRNYGTRKYAASRSFEIRDYGYYWYGKFIKY